MNNNRNTQQFKALTIIQKPIFVFLLIGIVGLSIRAYYFPYNLPIVLDGSIYYWYAIDMSLLGGFPDGYNFPNNGWPAFLSLFFSILRSDNFLDFMNLQRMLSTVISVLTMVPIYLLARRFFEKRYALIAAGIFTIEPRIIINSLLGIIEPSFIFLTVLVLFFILGNKIKHVYLAFGVAALAALTRYEGLLLLVPLTVAYFVRFRSEKRFVVKYFLALTIFVLILMPITYERIKTTGNDGIVSHVTAAAKAHPYIVEHTSQSSSYYNEVVKMTISALIRYLGWVQIPIFVFFVPVAVLIFFKNKRNMIKDPRVITAIVFVATMLLPAIYAYSRGIQETRYLYILFPIFCLMSSFTIKKIWFRFNRIKLFVTILCLGVIITSIGFIEIKGIDTKYQFDSFTVAKKISKITNGINSYSEDEYIKTTWIFNQKFPTTRNSIMEKPTLIFYNDTISYNDYLKYGKENGLTHIVTDGLFSSKSNIDTTLNDIFVHEKNYPYLQKIYDSSEDGYSYHIKVFAINYKTLESSN